MHTRPRYGTFQALRQPGAALGQGDEWGLKVVYLLLGYAFLLSQGSCEVIVLRSSLGCCSTRCWRGGASI